MALVVSEFVVFACGAASRTSWYAPSKQRIRWGPAQIGECDPAELCELASSRPASPPLPSAAGPLIELCFENRPRVWVRHGMWLALDIALGGGHISDERNESDQRQAAHGPVAEPQAGDRVRL
jgi:hypothetical protein